MDDYKNAMAGIYSPSVNKETLDESPMAYKNMDDIIANIGPTAKVLKIIKPVYNYKAAD
jgi:RNA-splicing ligase RtcB